MSHHRITITVCLIIVSQPQHVSSLYHNHSMSHHRITITVCLIIVSQSQHVSSPYHNHSVSHHRITTTACLIIVSQPQHVSSSYRNYHCRTYFYGTLKLSLSQEHEVVALVRRLFRSWDEMLALHCSNRTDVYNLVHWFHEDLICRGETSTHSSDGR
jgi:hypothetical protein